MSAQQELFDNIAKFVEDTRNLLSQGKTVEVAGLDQQVQGLCTKVLELSPGECEKYADLLQELLNQLTVLGEDLTIQKEAIAHEIRYLSSHKKASAAYKTADAKGNAAYGKDED